MSATPLDDGVVTFGSSAFHPFEVGRGVASAQWIDLTDEGRPARLKFLGLDAKRGAFMNLVASRSCVSAIVAAMNSRGRAFTTASLTFFIGACSSVHYPINPPLVESR